MIENDGDDGDDDDDGDGAAKRAVAYLIYDNSERAGACCAAQTEMESH